MSEPFLGEVKIVSFNFPPKGWAFCNGQLMPINQNQALFALLGTTFGGNGQTTFALPDFRGRVPIHVGAGHVAGERAGASGVTVTMQELPTHLHLLQAVSDFADNPSPAGGFLAAVDTSTFEPIYANASDLIAMSPQAVSNTGGSQPHNNMMPFLTLNFVVALQGIFPSRN